MVDIKITKEIKDACPNMSLAILQANVEVKSSSKELLNIIDEYSNLLMTKMTVEELASDSRIKDGRETYKKLGKSPSKYRLSSEALLRRVLQGKGLYRVNNIVDINNLISLKSRFPVGSYDLSNVDAEIILDKAEEGERYKGIGKDLINIENLPVLLDSKGPFGSPTSDSETAMIKQCSERIIMCIYSFSGEEDLKEYLEEAKELLKEYASGCDFEAKIIK